MSWGGYTYNPREGAFTYTSQGTAIGDSVTITLKKVAGASCTGGWNGAYFTAWDQYLTLTASDGCGPKTWTFVVGTFEQDTFAASEVWSTGVTNNAWTRRTGSTPSVNTGPSSAADGVRAHSAQRAAAQARSDPPASPYPPPPFQKAHSQLPPFCMLVRHHPHLRSHITPISRRAAATPATSS